MLSGRDCASNWFSSRVWAKRGGVINMFCARRNASRGAKNDTSCMPVRAKNCLIVCQRNGASNNEFNSTNVLFFAEHEV